ncbi:MAG: Vacuolar protein sorting-associated protein 8 [Trizodia sp. TS-e1964]|nr:MAG: Vacuolar protein sorting-associated protein 8 [Trizodia sp. TS-e1964]
MNSRLEENELGAESPENPLEGRTNEGDPYEAADEPLSDGDESSSSRLANSQRSKIPNGTSFQGYAKVELSAEEDSSSKIPELCLPPSPDATASNPDDSPSIAGSILSSPGRSDSISQASLSRLSPNQSLRPFDRRFQSYLSPSPLNSPRALSPAFLSPHSRQSSISSQALLDENAADTSSVPWEAVRWTKLKKINGQAYSEAGKRNFGRPTCVVVSASIALGTSKGCILIFDYHQTLRSIIGPGTKAVESGSITSIAFSADHMVIAGGHQNGNIFTWEVSRSARPFLAIGPIEGPQPEARKMDGHTPDAAILHLGFLGTRHTALVSSDNRGMAFSHLATRGLGAVGRAVKSTRILGRYPNDVAPSTGKARKPSAILALSPLPLGNAEQSTDSMGIVAMLTPYLLVIVSTTPVAQTQFKVARPKDLVAHGALSGCLAWFPAVKLKAHESISGEISKSKLVYCWSNVLTILDISELEPSEPVDSVQPPNLEFRPRNRWKADEAIVAVQWLSRSVLGVLTITQRLIILEDISMRNTESFDLIQRHIFHHDLFSRQLNSLVEQLDEEDVSLHGVVADAFYMSFRVYKNRIFLLGFNDISVGTLSNWADRLLALMANGDFIGAIELATSYYNGEANKLTVGLPENDTLRHSIVEEKLFEIMSASLKFVFSKFRKPDTDQIGEASLRELAKACFSACLSIGNYDYLLEDVFEWYEENGFGGIFLETLEHHVQQQQIKSIPPTVMKSLFNYYTANHMEGRLEEMICRMETSSMDIDQITTLCKRHLLYDALIYVWNQALGDYITPLIDLLTLIISPNSSNEDKNATISASNIVALKIFPYLSYTLTGRVYPTGENIPDGKSAKAKAEIYYFLFTGKTISWPKQGGKPFLTQRPPAPEPSFPYLRLILELDSSSFLSALNEAFEDSFLNDSPERMVNGGSKHDIGEEQVFGLSVNRQYVVTILLEIMKNSNFLPEDTIYLDMFIARNLAKYHQFLWLTGTSLHQVLVGLCNYPGKEIADDCQLSVEYLLSVYHPSDIDALIPQFTKAGFFRVLKSIFRTDRQYSKLLETYFEDPDDQDAVFQCISDCLRTGSGLSERQIRDFKYIIMKHARDLADINTIKTAETIETHSPSLHSGILSALVEDPYAQFIYLQTILGLPVIRSSNVKRSTESRENGFMEQYVRLMCEYDGDHVAEYVSFLQYGDVRLEEVLPALEGGGIVDAAVVLLARDGKIQGAMNRLTKHLGTLEAALIGLLGSAESASDAFNIEEAAESILESLDKYTKVGIWLCQGQTRTMTTAQNGKAKQSVVSRAKEDPRLLPEEKLWLDLIDVAVRVTKDVSAMLQRSSTLLAYTDQNEPKFVTLLRFLVQQIFTALLTATSTSAGRTRHVNISFLKIMRAFLVHASLSSPALSDLRAVLASIFSAYTYEESLLSLANRLLEKDLFLHVEEVSKQRQRGWRPKGNVCEACKRRVWGPGAGGKIWEKWEEKREMDAHRKRLKIEEAKSGMDRGKGRAQIARQDEALADKIIQTPKHPDDTEDDEGAQEAVEEDLGPLIIFSCKHVFHQRCIEGLHSRAEMFAVADGKEFRCFLCK